MLRASSLLIVIAGLALASSCTPTPVEGEGEPREGEGEPAAEGEGEPAEGEGEVPVGEGEGEEPAGEGEGEGEGGPNADGVDNPTPATLPFSQTVTVGTDDESDCFSFTAQAGDVITLKTSIGGSTVCSDDTDTRVSLYDAADAIFPLDSNDDADLVAERELCSFLQFAVETSGSFIACAEPFSVFSDVSFTGLFEITVAPRTLLGPNAPCVPDDIAAVCNPSPSAGVTLECRSAADPASGTCVSITLLAAGASCDRADDTERCTGEDRCLDFTVGVSTCGVADAAGTGEPCVDGDDSGVPCEADLVCTNSVCVDPRIEACDALPVAATLGQNNGTISDADRDLLDGSCSFTPRREQTFTYTTAAGGEAARLQVTAAGSGFAAVYILTDCLAGVEAACETGNGAAFIETDPLAPGTFVNIVVEGELNTNFTLQVAEAPIDIRAENETCDDIRPAAPTVNRVCGAGLACVAGTCVPDAGDRNAPQSATLPMNDQSVDIAPVGDEDCFSVIVETPGTFDAATLGACTTAGAADTSLELRQIDERLGSGTIRSSFESSGSISAGGCEDLSDSVGIGEYLVCVSETGDDELANGILVDATLTPTITDGDGNTFRTPTAVATTSTTPYAVAVSDVDCFSFTLAAATSGLTIDNNDCDSDTLITLFNVDATPFVIERDDDGGDGLCSQITGRALPLGNYRACVEDLGNDAASTGNLRLLLE